MEGIRRLKVEDQLREEIAKLIMRGDVKDPRVNSFISITRVEVARDASHAKVFASTFEDASSLDLAIEGLNNAAGYIQREVGKVLRLRLTPRLDFLADHGIQEGFELNEKIKGLFT